MTELRRTAASWVKGISPLAETTNLFSFYQELYDTYGPQGWWPLLDVAGTNPTHTGSLTGYHVGEYEYPLTREQRFEICLGAILTQNTAWPNVERALVRLRSCDALSPEGLDTLDDRDLQDAIRPSGYYKMKARKLRCFNEWFQRHGCDCPSRKALLSIWGIGPETADSILLYAYSCTEMVVDAYTRRILAARGAVASNISYDLLKEYCRANLPRDLIVYQEYHALMVEHAKRTRRSV